MIPKQKIPIEILEELFQTFCSNLEANPRLRTWCLRCKRELIRRRYEDD